MSISLSDHVVRGGVTNSKRNIFSSTRPMAFKFGRMWLMVRGTHSLSQMTLWPFGHMTNKNVIYASIRPVATKISGVGTQREGIPHIKS